MKIALSSKTDNSGDCKSWKFLKNRSLPGAIKWHRDPVSSGKGYLEDQKGFSEILAVLLGTVFILAVVGGSRGRDKECQGLCLGFIDKFYEGVLIYFIPLCHWRNQNNVLAHGAVPWCAAKVNGTHSAVP